MSVTRSGDAVTRNGILRGYVIENDRFSFPDAVTKSTRLRQGFGGQARLHQGYGGWVPEDCGAATGRKSGKSVSASDGNKGVVGATMGADAATLFSTA
jgi:hypothetical protein